jgi:hypothetical protein
LDRYSWWLPRFRNADQATQGLWRFDELVKELVIELTNDTDAEIVEVETIDTSSLWRLAYLNVKV